MARPRNDGLSYFPFDVDFFSDKKIKRLRAKFGNDGVMVYIYLLCQIYTNGYYADLDEDLILDISEELNLSENATTQILNYLVSRSLFNDTLANSVKVLSATSVQKRYQEAKKGAKRDVFVKADTWILNSDETLGFIKVRPKKGFSENNPSFSENNSDKSENYCTKESKVKESKVKESKGEYGGRAARILTLDEKALLVSEHGINAVEAKIRRLDKWKSSHSNLKTSDYELLAKWLNEDKPDKREQKQASFTDNSLDELAMARYEEGGNGKN